MNPPSKRYLVILPVQLPDNSIHQIGEVIELDEDTALAYRHALVAETQQEEDNGR